MRISEESLIFDRSEALILGDRLLFVAEGQSTKNQIFRRFSEIFADKVSKIRSELKTAPYLEAYKFSISKYGIDSWIKFFEAMEDVVDKSAENTCRFTEIEIKFVKDCLNSLKTYKEGTKAVCAH